MRLLVLGGTQFVGHAIVSAALGLGWEVTTFNRGMSGADVAGARALRGDRALAADLATLSAAGPWDAAIDTSGYVPREVLASSERLEPIAARYVFMSTVSVYRGWPVEPLSEASEVLYCCRPSAVVAQQGRSGRPGACPWIARQVNSAGRRS